MFVIAGLVGVNNNENNVIPHKNFLMHEQFSVGTLQFTQIRVLKNEHDCLEICQFVLSCHHYQKNPPQANILSTMKIYLKQIMYQFICFQNLLN